MWKDAQFTEKTIIRNKETNSADPVVVFLMRYVMLTNTALAPLISCRACKAGPQRLKVPGQLISLLWILTHQYDALAMGSTFLGTMSLCMYVTRSSKPCQLAVAGP
jgi:hypothetical protein